MANFYLKIFEFYCTVEGPLKTQVKRQNGVRFLVGLSTVYFTKILYSLPVKGKDLKNC